MNMKSNISLSLLLILVLAVFLRLYKLDVVPPALNWDEIDAGYNAYTIANWGRDEWGDSFPLVFTSFKDDKHPVHIYLTTPFIKVFGLSDFITRFPSALMGTVSILIIYFLSLYLFRNQLTATLSALFLAVSPYHLQFSRGLWESNFALSFFLLGLMLFYRALKYNGKLLSLSYLSFGISLFSYHSSKIVVIPIVVLLTVLYFKELKRRSFNFYSAIVVILTFITILIISPRLTGLARVKQTQFNQSEIEKTQIFKKTGSSFLGLGEATLNGLLAHFTPEYLFLKGDQSSRNSVKVFGEFYKIDALFLIIGLIILLNLRSRVTLVMFLWLLISPLPASVVQGAPNANRAIFMLGSLNLITALGASSLIGWFKGRSRAVIIVAILIALSIQVFSFLNYYFNVYPKKDPHDWQYGMKQAVEFVKDHDEEYDQVFMTEARSQPYIFFLYYLKTPLPEFLRRAFYNHSDSKSFSTVSAFGKYYFGGWDTVESMPLSRVLYILTTTEYDGLKHKVEFDVKKIIRFPDGTNAFFVISTK